MDAAALVAVALKERGHDVLTTILTAGSATTTPTGLAEALTICRRNGHKQFREELSNGLLDIGLTVEPIVEEYAVKMAFLLAKSDELPTRDVGSLSLGDAAWEILGIPDLKIMPFR